MVIRKYHHKFGVLRGRAPATAHTDVSPSRRRPDNSNGLSENRPHGKLPDSRTNGNRLSATCQAGLCDRPPAARKVPYSVSQGGGYRTGGADGRPFRCLRRGRRKGLPAKRRAAQTRIFAAAHPHSRRRRASFGALHAAAQGPRARGAGGRRPGHRASRSGKQLEDAYRFLRASPSGSGSERREPLTTAPSNAKQAAITRAMWVLLSGVRWKSSATRAAPVV